MVHRREIDGEPVLFGVHGALWGNAMTWWDHGTGSIWSQAIGEAIAGPLKGETVELMTSEFTTWAAWVDEHPNTVALDVPAGPSSFDLADFLIVIDFDDAARAYPVPDLRAVGVVNDVVAGVELAVVSDPRHPDRWTVFSRSIADRIVQLEVDGDVLRDRSTSATFDPARGFVLDFGNAPDLDGLILDQLPALTAFPDDFDTFWPSGTVWEP